VRFENARLPLDARAVHTIDLDRWGENPDSAEFRNLSRALSALFSPAPRSSPIGPTGIDDGTISIAVLPFVNMSPDADQEYFSDGLSEELINQLAHVKGLRISGRTSSFAFKGKTDDFRLIGNKLGVNHVLEGSVRKAGSRLRITAQLIKCRDGFNLWSATYDRQLDDVFAIQEDVARAVTGALGVTLRLSEQSRVPGGTTNLEAYDLFLRARALSATRGPEAPRSLDLYRKALTLDPEFALAWVGLASAIIDSIIFYPRTNAVLRPEMEQAIARAVELAPALPETLAGQAMLGWMHYDWAGIEESLTAWGGRGGDTSGSFAYSLGTLGRLQAAVGLCLTTRQADPLAIGVSFDLQVLLDISGRFAEAEAEYERSKDLLGNRGSVEWRAVTRLMARKDARFRPRFAAYVEAGLSWMPFDSQLLQVLDEPEPGRKVLRAAFNDPAYQDGARLGAMAMWAVHFGDPDLAIEALRRGFVEMHGPTIIDIWHPVFAELRRDPRFKHIVRDVGLADHWRKTGNWGDFARAEGADDFEIIR
jgi:TolB-like protein